MAQIRSSSAELIAFFETGDVPTADNFNDFIRSTAVYDGSLPSISGSSLSTGSFGHLISDEVSSHLNPSKDNNYDLGSPTLEWRNLYIDGIAYADSIEIDTGSISVLSSSLTPDSNNTYSLGSVALTYHTIHTSTASIGIISSSLVPDADNTWDLGASGIEWKDLYIDGTAYIDTIDNTSAVNIVTASINLVSSSLIPDADDTWDLGASGREWKDLYVDGTAHIDTLSIDSLDNDVSITGISSSTQVLQLSGSFIPATDDTYNLGSETQQWKDLHINGMAHVDSASIGFVSSSLVPYTDDTYDLGSSGNEWKDLYIDGTANIDTLSNTTATITTGNITNSNITTSSILAVSSSLIPETDNTWDLGSSTHEYKDLYIDGTANIDTLAADTGSMDVLVVNNWVSSSLTPDVDDAYDLGSATNQWKDLYIDGTGNIDLVVSDTGSFGRINSGLIPSLDDTYDLGSSDFRYNEIYAASQSLSTSASLSAIKFENLPTSEDQARLIGTGSLYLGGPSGSDSRYLLVFTG